MTCSNVVVVCTVTTDGLALLTLGATLSFIPKRFLGIALGSHIYYTSSVAIFMFIRVTTCM